jgi:L-histidine N-alpha-methyltransferase
MNTEGNTITLGSKHASNTGTQQFYNDVIAGLSTEPKRLDSKYFYDAAGDELFQGIMNSPEYYLTNCELEIFSEQTRDLAELITTDGAGFDLIELGAGDALKSTYLLKYLLQQNIDFTYLPIDISAHVIQLLDDNFSKHLPGLKFTGLNGEYFDMLKKAGTISGKRKVVLFLGSNIGNMPIADAENFCVALREHLSPGDMALVGFDLKKHPKTILDAYNDKAGVTCRFNLNLLQRINRELGADFNTRQFDHYPTYDPATGTCKSYLVSTTDQDVHFKRTGKFIHFNKDEYIHMETSQKFTLQQITDMGVNAGFEPVKYMFDKKGWYTDAIWVAK